MSRFNDQTVFAAFQPYLQSGEVLVNAAFCFYRPSQLLGCLLTFLPELLSRFYMVGLTNHNFIVLRVARSFGGNIRVIEFFGYSLDQLPAIQATTYQGFWTFETLRDLEIKDPARPFKVVFPGVGVPDNRQRGLMIASTLFSRWQQRQFPSGGLAYQSQAIPSSTQVGAFPAGSAPIAARAQFSPQMRPTTYVPQSSHMAFGCLGAAMITFGTGIVLFFALAFLGFLMDEKKSQKLTAGLVVFILLLFSATVIAIGIFFVVHGRKKKAAAMYLQRAQTNMSITGQMPRQFP